MSAETTPQAGTFGNISKPGRSGILGLPIGVSLAGVPFIVVIVLMMTKQWLWQALVLALIAITAAAVMVLTRKQGRSIYGRRMLKIAQRRKEKAGKHVYLAGPTGKTRDGRCRLPGLLAPSEISEHKDPYDNPFGMIRVVGQGVKNYSVVLVAHADGDELQSKSVWIRWSLTGEHGWPSAVSTRKSAVLRSRSRSRQTQVYVCVE